MNYNELTDAELKLELIKTFNIDLIFALAVNTHSEFSSYLSNIIGTAMANNSLSDHQAILLCHVFIRAALADE